MTNARHFKWWSTPLATPKMATPKLSDISSEDNHLKPVAKCPAQPKEPGLPNA